MLGPPWMMDGGMRPNFPPRFDGPPGFRGPPGQFDDFHPRSRRFDDRRRFPKHEHGNDIGDDLYERPERRSRWGGNSPTNDNQGAGDSNNDESISNAQEPNEEFNDDYKETGDGGNSTEEMGQDNSEDVDEGGSTTPLRDEVPNNGATKDDETEMSERNESDVTLNADKAEVEEQA